MTDKKLCTYKNFQIIESPGGCIQTVSPDGSRFIVGMDDSKGTGQRVFTDATVEDAKSYIDYLTRPDRILNGIMVHKMYRDADNYKTYDADEYHNDLGLSVEEVTELVSEAVGIEEPFIAEDLGLINIAPNGNEYMGALNDYDHSYIEITNVTKVDSVMIGCSKPLSEFVGLLKSYKKNSGVNAQKRKATAREELQKQLQQLG